MKPRVLVCVLAQTRAHAVTWSSFQKYVLNELGADLAICIAKPDGYDADNPFWIHSKYKWTAPEFADYGAAFDEAVNAMNLNPKDWRLLLKVREQWLGGIKGENPQPGSAAILIYFRWLLLQRIIAEKLVQQYDAFVITRSDFVWTCPHPPIEGDDAIWIPWGEGYGGYTDRHAIVPTNWIATYLDILSPILQEPERLAAEMQSQPYWNLERYIKFHLERATPKPTVKHFPFVMYSVREKSGETRWASGVWNSRLGYFIKYPLEYVSATSVVSAFVSGGGWKRALSLRKTPKGYVFTGHLVRAGCGAPQRADISHCLALTELHHEELKFLDGNLLGPVNSSIAEIVPALMHLQCWPALDNAFMLRLGDSYLRVTSKGTLEQTRLLRVAGRNPFLHAAARLGLLLHGLRGGLFSLSTTRLDPSLAQRSSD